MFRLFSIQPGGAHSSQFLCPFALISLFVGHFLVFLLEAHLALFLTWSWNPAFLQGVPLLQMLSSALSPTPHSVHGATQTRCPAHTTYFFSPCAGLSLPCLGSDSLHEITQTPACLFLDSDSPHWLSESLLGLIPHWRPPHLPTLHLPLGITPLSYVMTLGPTCQGRGRRKDVENQHKLHVMDNDDQLGEMEKSRIGLQRK